MRRFTVFHRLRGLLLYGLALVLPLPALACMDDAATPRQMSDCAASEVERLTALARRLDDAVATRYEVADPALLARLFEAWEKLRDTECRFDASLLGQGSAVPLVLNQCRIAWTTERIRRRSLLLCEGAGTTGQCDASRQYLEGS